MQPIHSQQIPSQTIEPRPYEKSSYASNQAQSNHQTHPHHMSDTIYSLENVSNDLPSNLEKQMTPDQSALEQSSKRPTRCSAQQITQISLKSPSKSPGKSPHQMEIARQKSESSRGRSRGARNTNVSRGAANRIPISSRGRGRGRAPLVVPMGKKIIII